MKPDGTRGLYIDMWPSANPPEVDGFVLSVGAGGKIGTLYHIAEVHRVVPRPGTKRRLERYQMRVFKANDLLKPDEPYMGLGFSGREYFVPTGPLTMKVAITITWYKRAKKKQK